MEKALFNATRVGESLCTTESSSAFLLDVTETLQYYPQSKLRGDKSGEVCRELDMTASDKSRDAVQLRGRPQQEPGLRCALSKQALPVNAD